VKLTKLTILSSVWPTSHPLSPHRHCGTTPCVVSILAQSQLRLQSACSVPHAWRRHTDTSSCSFRLLGKQISVNWRFTFAVSFLGALKMREGKCRIGKFVICFCDTAAYKTTKCYLCEIRNRATLQIHSPNPLSTSTQSIIHPSIFHSIHYSSYHTHIIHTHQLFSL